jgi:hypothetical protein
MVAGLLLSDDRNFASLFYERISYRRDSSGVRMTSYAFSFLAGQRLKALGNNVLRRSAS